MASVFMDNLPLMQLYLSASDIGGMCRDAHSNAITCPWLAFSTPNMPDKQIALPISAMNWPGF